MILFCQGREHVCRIRGRFGRVPPPSAMMILTMMTPTTEVFSTMFTNTRWYQPPNCLSLGLALHRLTRFHCNHAGNHVARMRPTISHTDILQHPDAFFPTLTPRANESHPAFTHCNSVFHAARGASQCDTSRSRRQQR